MKKITLSRGFIAMVSDEDYERVSGHKWSLAPGGKSRVLYAESQGPLATGKRGAPKTKLHRFILNAPAGIQVDHIDGNGLNCQRENLRLCNKAQNMRNRGAPTNNTSGYKGVTWDKKNKKWRSKIMVDGVDIHIGRFTTAEAAARAYDSKARELFREFARPNFPYADPPAPLLTIEHAPQTAQSQG